MSQPQDPIAMAQQEMEYRVELFNRCEPRRANTRKTERACTALQAATHLSRETPLVPEISGVQQPLTCR